MAIGGLAARFGKALFYGWKTSIAALVVGMTISFSLFGFFMPYWRIADQDLPLAHQGLLLNDGL